MNSLNRRTRFWTLTFIMLALALASLIFLNIIMARRPMRFDATAAGEHEVSPRTKRLLENLPAEFSILVWANFSEVDADAKQNVVDVIGQFRRTTQRVTVATADVGTADGLNVFTGVLTDLAERDKQGIITHGQQVRRVIKATNDFAAILADPVSGQLTRLSEALTDPGARNAIASRAQAVQAAGSEFQKIAAAAGNLLATDAANSDAALTTLRDGLASPLLQFATFGREIAKLAENSPEPTVSARAGELAKTLEPARARVAAELEALIKTPRPAIARVAQAIKSPRGVLVIGPANLGLVALDFDELFAAQGGRADRRHAAEDLFASALISLSNPAKPIVVLTHAETQLLLHARARLFDELGAHFSRRGMDLVEYSAALQPTPPTPEELDPGRTRPIVFLVLAPDSSTPAQSAADQPGAQRAQALGTAISKLAAAGAAICLSVNPSLLPMSDQQDPVTTFALDFGLRIDSGRPMTRTQGAPGKQVSSFDFVLQPAPSEHVISRAIEGLPTFFGFPISYQPYKPTDGSIVAVTPLYAVPSSDDTWAEHSWITTWQAPANQRGAMAPAEFDAAKDVNRGPFPIACAVERTRPDGIDQRLVYVGSNNYFADFVTQAKETIDGRQVATFPGNLELLESSILWLARQEASIAPAPSAQTIAIIQPLTKQRVNLLRIVLIAGVPVLVLGVGVLYRLLRS